ncbi:MAG: hypothetical protein FWC55_09005 [Firmicutes bacterium]|nr:hypothetical protein [Bacillota bacterium]
MRRENKTGGAMTGARGRRHAGDRVPDLSPLPAALAALLVCQMIFLRSAPWPDQAKARQPVQTLAAAQGAAGKGIPVYETPPEIAHSGILTMPAEKAAGIIGGGSSKTPGGGYQPDKTEPTTETMNGGDKTAALERLTSDLRALLAENQELAGVLIETPMDEPVDKPVNKPAGKLTDKPTDNTLGKPTDNPLGARKSAAALRLTIPGGIAFERQRAGLKPETAPILMTVAGALRSLPAEVRIEAYPDDRPINTPQFPNGWILASARAVSAGIYMIEQGGADPARVTAVGINGPAAAPPESGGSGLLVIIIEIE